MSDPLTRWIVKDDDRYRIDDLPPELVASLSELPEPPPEDFACAICMAEASNRRVFSARDYERPPICKSCETVTGYSWTGQARHRSPLSGGTHRDRRNTMRIAALADALRHEANRQKWSNRYGRS